MYTQSPCQGDKYEVRTLTESPCVVSRSGPPCQPVVCYRYHFRVLLGRSYQACHDTYHMVIPCFWKGREKPQEKRVSPATADTHHCSGRSFLSGACEQAIDIGGQFYVWLESIHSTSHLLSRFSRYCKGTIHFPASLDTSLTRITFSPRSPTTPFVDLQEKRPCTSDSWLARQEHGRRRR